eukprot:CAMPEP_0175095774 /NCGR_PEP_ID=MMETSP0086_2-20121207/4354_1 /TAXON_ID=136419 /ORGANISM="Unknown Unknown, Strain D1" /LENGTH=795 /DNA_ID=CAMNT_0016369083 /DNA_START=58 /DNA_END=2445 /DNA_ORIENTATION=+
MHWAELLVVLAAFAAVITNADQSLPSELPPRFNDVLLNTEDNSFAEIEPTYHAVLLDETEEHLIDAEREFLDDKDAGVLSDHQQQQSPSPVSTDSEVEEREEEENGNVNAESDSNSELTYLSRRSAKRIRNCTAGCMKKCKGKSCKKCTKVCIGRVSKKAQRAARKAGKKLIKAAWRKKHCHKGYFPARRCSLVLNKKTKAVTKKKCWTTCLNKAKLKKTMAKQRKMIRNRSQIMCKTMLGSCKRILAKCRALKKTATTGNKMAALRKVMCHRYHTSCTAMERAARNAPLGTGFRRSRSPGAGSAAKPGPRSALPADLAASRALAEVGPTSGDVPKAPASAAGALTTNSSLLATAAAERASATRKAPSGIRLLAEQPATPARENAPNASLTATAKSREEEPLLTTAAAANVAAARDNSGPKANALKPSKSAAKAVGRCAAVEPATASAASLSHLPNIPCVCAAKPHSPTAAMSFKSSTGQCNGAAMLNVVKKMMCLRMAAVCRRNALVCRKFMPGPCGDKCKPCKKRKSHKKSLKKKKMKNAFDEEQESDSDDESDQDNQVGSETESEDESETDQDKPKKPLCGKQCTAVQGRCLRKLKKLKAARAAALAKARKAQQRKILKASKKCGKCRKNCKECRYCLRVCPKDRKAVKSGKCKKCLRSRKTCLKKRHTCVASWEACDKKRTLCFRKALGYKMPMKRLIINFQNKKALAKTLKQLLHKIKLSARQKKNGKVWNRIAKAVKKHSKKGRKGKEPRRRRRRKHTQKSNKKSKKTTKKSKRNTKKHKSALKKAKKL